MTSLMMLHKHKDRLNIRMSNNLMCMCNVCMIYYMHGFSIMANFVGTTKVDERCIKRQTTVCGGLPTSLTHPSTVPSLWLICTPPCSTSTWQQERWSPSAARCSAVRWSLSRWTSTEHPPLTGEQRNNTKHVNYMCVSSIILFLSLSLITWSTNAVL